MAFFEQVLPLLHRGAILTRRGWTTEMQALGSPERAGWILDATDKMRCFLFYPERAPLPHNVLNVHVDDLTTSDWEAYYPVDIGVPSKLVQLPPVPSPHTSLDQIEAINDRLEIDWEFARNLAVCCTLYCDRNGLLGDKELSRLDDLLWEFSHYKRDAYDSANRWLSAAEKLKAAYRVYRPDPPLRFSIRPSAETTYEMDEKEPQHVSPR